MAANKKYYIWYTYIVIEEYNNNELAGWAEWHRVYINYIGEPTPGERW